MTAGGLALAASLVVGAPVSSAATEVQDVDVKWNRGSGPAQMSKGLPNPPGWYRAAVGPRTDEKVLYLTFDDGPSAYTPALLKALRKHDAKATFFVLGGPAQANPSVLKRMKRDGHAIGNHTWSHPRLTLTPSAQVRQEMRQPKAAVGKRLDACMRPPYGMIDERVAKIAIKSGFQPVMWTAHIEDWAPHSFDWTVARLKKSTKPGAVILMHDTHSQTVAAVKKMLPKWKKRGYVMRPVPACEAG